jgi:hypothetical protein
MKYNIPVKYIDNNFLKILLIFNNLFVIRFNKDNNKILKNNIFIEKINFIYIK